MQSLIGGINVCKFASNQEMAKLLNSWAEGHVEVSVGTEGTVYKVEGEPIDAECEYTNPKMNLGN